MDKKHTQWTAHRRQSGGSERRKSRERTEDGWTQGLALRAAMMMYPFALWDVGGGRVGGGPAGRLFLGVVGRSIGQIHLHVVRHFFQEVRGDQTAVAVHLTLWTGLERWEELYLSLNMTYASCHSVVTEAPLSHRKHCSLNASSVVLPLILWLCDITLCHHVTHLHNWCTIWLIVRHLRIDLIQLHLLGAGLGMCELTNQRILGIYEAGALKRQERKQTGWNAVLLNWTVWQNWCIFWTLKHVNLLWQ